MGEKKLYINVFSFLMKDIILFFITFIRSKDSFVYVDGYYCRSNSFSYFPLKNKQGFSIYNIRKKIIYELWEPWS